MAEQKGIEVLPATHEEWTREIANSVWHIAPVPPGLHRSSLPIPRRNPLSPDEIVFI